MMFTIISATGAILCLIVLVRLIIKFWRTDPESVQVNIVMGVFIYMLFIFLIANAMQWIPDWITRRFRTHSEITLAVYRASCTFGLCVLGWYAGNFLTFYFDKRSKIIEMLNAEPTGQVVPLAGLQEGTERFKTVYPGLTYATEFDIECFEQLLKLKAVGAKKIHCFNMINADGLLDHWFCPGDGIGNLLSLPAPKSQAARSTGEGEEDPGGYGLNHGGLNPPKGGGKG